MKQVLTPTPLDLASFEANAAEVAALLKALGNRKRLMVMCKLAEHGEMRVNDLANEVALSQSALSQHLAKMRAEGLVEYRREAQALWYRIADPRCESLLATLHQLYCRED
ncbi:metalloregulator ArsR/SmtB family transcription factor [Altererythrobacter arenosus]|uniref:Metalloregulator ArsR/SmtB family transcription factor n=1 Tax=Altererythrobacter arenosus TaxID=3032592 RepID=A0ABY8FV19_9SPHN|nr:metalloregulator ArsR/SmtB family transcription factor [Altererythrobacter sp. CAU 1644]WFL78853.1 metalloregulator ArsR/SmtB family transcription factor [Altererythrobacter sp. CAU 1644]